MQTYEAKATFATWRAAVTADPDGSKERLDHGFHHRATALCTKKIRDIITEHRNEYQTVEEMINNTKGSNSQ